ncbi:MAG TPA: energy transducer TonB [Brevundimonas sp.]|nr:energy transducer TonB [Brevundimonas sp.]
MTTNEDGPGAAGVPVGQRWVEPVVWTGCIVLMAAAAWGAAWALEGVRVEWEVLSPVPTEVSTPEGLLQVRRAQAPETAGDAKAEADSSARSGDRPVVIVNPKWEIQPQPVYPVMAMLLGKTEGMARVRCRTGADGSVYDCKVRVERPGGVGFGRETVRAAEQARVRARTHDGTPVRSAIEFTTRYRLE